MIVMLVFASIAVVFFAVVVPVLIVMALWRLRRKRGVLRIDPKKLTSIVTLDALPAPAEDAQAQYANARRIQGSPSSLDYVATVDEGAGVGTVARRRSPSAGPSIMALPPRRSSAPDIRLGAGPRRASSALSLEPLPMTEPIEESPVEDLAPQNTSTKPLSILAALMEPTTNAPATSGFSPPASRPAASKPILAMLMNESE